jgi:predicted MFS family arabinose efflux permease
MTIRAADELGSQMLNVAIGWYVYAQTHNPMSLAYIGLAQFLPNVGLVLLAGHAADRFDRRRVIGVSLGLETLAVALFAAWYAWSVARVRTAGPVYLLLLILGAARAFSSPAMSAMLPRAVSNEEFPRAVAATSSVFQICGIVGPALGGLLYAGSGRVTFAVAAALYLLAMTETRRLPEGRLAPRNQPADPTDKGMLAGIRYIRSNRLLLSLISLDLFAVLLGGVTALLPIYARDILRVGPMGLGWLRAAPGVGAAGTGLVLAHRTIERSAGKRMLGSVAGFGVATVVFALSRNFWLSLAALTVAGGFDMISMVIRHTLVQISTPDAMRGRVSALNWVFIGASSELGEFESGATAAWFGTVPAALLGGLGTVAVVALWSTLFPELRGTRERAMEKTNDAAIGGP